jgi:hypothetical protein
MSIIAALAHTKITKGDVFDVQVRTHSMKEFLEKLCLEKGQVANITVKKPSRYIKSKQHLLEIMAEKQPLINDFVAKLGLKIIE